MVLKNSCKELSKSNNNFDYTIKPLSVLAGRGYFFVKTTHKLLKKFQVREVWNYMIYDV